MKKQRFPKYIVYAVLSLVSPIIAFSATAAYQSFAHSDFWNSMTHDEHAAGAMMAFAEGMQLIFFTVIGCFVGVIFALISVWLWFEQRNLRKLITEE